jgi:hypothetical protein
MDVKESHPGPFKGRTQLIEMESDMTDVLF